MRPERYIAICWFAVMAAMYALPSFAVWLVIACACSFVLPMIAYYVQRWHRTRPWRPDMPRARVLRRSKETAPPII